MKMIQLTTQTGVENYNSDYITKVAGPIDPNYHATVTFAYGSTNFGVVKVKETVAAIVAAINS